MKERTMALAGIFQATELVRQAANHGTWSGYAADTCLDSLLAIEADTVEDIYGDASNLRLGAETLISVLQGDRRHMESLGYAVSIMQLENNFRKKTKMQSQIGLELQSITTIDDGLENTRFEICRHKKLPIFTPGPSARFPLASSSTVAHNICRWIERSTGYVHFLFAGLRSAVLWRQMGGGRFSLMFGRKKMLEQAQTLLPG